MVKNLQIAELKFTVRLRDTFHAGILPMKTFRGGLGVLKEMLCTPVNGICKKCEEGTCLYSHFFEEKQGVYRDTYIGHVRPFILKNRYSRKTTYEKGEFFSFSIHLFGTYI